MSARRQGPICYSGAGRGRGRGLASSQSGLRKKHHGLGDERLSPSAATPRRPARYSAPRSDALLGIKNVARSLQVHVQYNVWGEAGAWVSAPRQGSLQHAPPAVFFILRCLARPVCCKDRHLAQGAAVHERREGLSVCSQTLRVWFSKRLLVMSWGLLFRH